jgi:hypothetical protein
MMEYLNFFSGSYDRAAIGLFLFVALCLVFCHVVSQPRRIIEAVQRGRNIRAHGWPPEHCNANGFLRTEPVASGEPEC